MIALKGILEKDTALQVGFVLFYPILKTERTWSYLSLFTALVPPPFPLTAIFPVALLVSHYLNNRVFLSRNYRLIVAPVKFDVLKTNISPRSEASRANMLVLRTSNFQGATIRPIAPRHKHSIVFIVHH